MTRQHGFQWPLAFLQVVSWLNSLLQLGYTHSVILPFLDHTEFWMAPYAFTAVLSCVLLVSCKATITDPTDPKLLAITQPHQLVYNSQVSFFCGICRSTFSILTKHCSCCGRCVWQFYSHSRLINNCVGWNNYNYYRLLLGLLTSSQMILAYFSCKLLVSCFSDEVSTRLKCIEIYGNDFLNVLVAFHSVILASACSIGVISLVSSVCVCKDTRRRMTNSQRSFVELSETTLRTVRTVRTVQVPERYPDDIGTQTDSSPTFLDVTGESEITFRVKAEM